MAKSGWYKESARHSLAAKGVPTGRKSNMHSKSFLRKANPDYNLIPTLIKDAVELDRYPYDEDYEGNVGDAILYYYKGDFYLYKQSYDGKREYVEKVEDPEIIDEYSKEYEKKIFGESWEKEGKKAKGKLGSYD